MLFECLEAFVNWNPRWPRRSKTEQNCGILGAGRIFGALPSPEIPRLTYRISFSGGEYLIIHRTEVVCAAVCISLRALTV